jgi:hypothetical protein
VPVVVAAGNTGYGTVTSRERSTAVGLDLTINDPGNAEFAITVGSTHRDMPHRCGVSFSLPRARRETDVPNLILLHLEKNPLLCRRCAPAGSGARRKDFRNSDGVHYVEDSAPVWLRRM